MSCEKDDDPIIPGTESDKDTSGADNAGQLKDSEERPGKTFKEVQESKSAPAPENDLKNGDSSVHLAP
ncbi:hypothetical protein KF728_12535 [Candidatus Obscuribacterales bacterium]|nr:hypothetical protein [Candidatus Obscuribacterales bacterium]MBX3150969.1 hypothetical protein [Candidatus Obscuribacterales bacterium]